VSADIFFDDGIICGHDIADDGILCRRDGMAIDMVDRQYFGGSAGNKDPVHGKHFRKQGISFQNFITPPFAGGKDHLTGDAF
jgi:hypothetical protein